MYCVSDLLTWVCMQSCEQARLSCPVSLGPLRGQFDSSLKFKTEGASQAVLALGLTSKKKKQKTKEKEKNNSQISGR